MSVQYYSSGRGQPSAHDQHTAVGQDELARQLSEVARSLQSQTDTDTMLDELVSAAVRPIPRADEGSISVLSARRQVTARSPTGPLSQQVDAVQTEVGQGPSLDAALHQETVRVADMATERRWPRFAHRAADIGAASMLSIPLDVDGNSLGALNLYSHQPNAFTDESEHTGLIFASHAAIAYASTQTIDQLHRAVDSRDLIGQAKGILMERYQITADQAFQVLTRVSQQQNRKLRDLAHELTSRGQLTGLNQTDNPTNSCRG